MSEELDIEEPPDPAPKAPKPKPLEQRAPAPALNGINGTNPELYLISGLMLGPEDLPRCAHLPPEAFEDADARRLYGVLRGGLTWPMDLFAIEKASGLSKGRLFDISNLLPTSEQTLHFIEEVETAWRARRLKRLGAEMSHGENTDPEHWAARLAEFTPQKSDADAEGLGAYDLPPDNDASVLLGDRYLNLGDGAVISGQSGIGKSSLARQMMAHWALGLPFRGIKPNGPLTSLEIQAEDSRGDIGEVRLSIEHGMKLTDGEMKLVNERVKIVTERVRRGPKFFDRLRRLIAKHKPRLLWINPLQAFIEGDVTEARDLGEFLRTGLNGLNGDNPAFASFIIHHTTKPATGKERAERLWHEEMYGMAGGAEIINWARGIMILKATETPGEFNLLLAKRGVRAGVTRPTSKDSMIHEPVTSIPLRWSTESIEVKGRAKKLKSLFWESRAPSPEEAAKIGKKAGVPRLYAFGDFRKVFPDTEEAACGYIRAHALAKQIKPIGVSAFYNVIGDGVAIGELLTNNDERGRPRYWLKKT